MSAIIIVEDGTGTNTQANSYVAIADADAYFLTAIVHADWDAASEDTKTRCILSSVRFLDNCVSWQGWKANLYQALQWPRVLARDPNQYGGAYYRRPDTYLAQYYDSTVVPQGVKDAVCELARFFLQASNANDDRTADAPGKGISEFSLFQGLMVKFDKTDQREIIPDAVKFLIDNFGDTKSARSGNARVARL